MPRVASALPLLAILSCFSEAPTVSDSSASNVDTTTSTASMDVETENATTDPSGNSGENHESSTSPADGTDSSESTGASHASSGDSSAGSSSESTGGEPVSCADDDDCGEGMWCNWSVGPPDGNYFCDPIYDEAHCDESCPPGDRVNTEQNGTAWCVCAPTCLDDGDCDAPATCGSFGDVDRCFIGCQVVPCSSNTPGLACPPAYPMPEATPVYMCMWMGEGP